MRYLIYFSILFLTVACGYGDRVHYKAVETQNPLLDIMQHDSLLRAIAADPAKYDVQIIYTQIDRDAQNTPHFKTYQLNADATQYFYPASTVKMPLALLSIEKINALRRQGVSISLDTPYRIDSVRNRQIPYSIEPTSATKLPSIGHDVRYIFTVSDNYAYNHFIEFLGRENINKSLLQKGYAHTRIMHRFSISGIDNRFSAPITFFSPDQKVCYAEGEKQDATTYTNQQKDLRKGQGYIDNNDSLVMQPFDFSTKNYAALHDLNDMLQAVIFPESVPAQKRFDLSADDYNFVYKWMSIWPRESDFPPLKSPEYYDGYCKFLMYGDDTTQRPDHIRIFNKVGDAYGFLTDVAYIVDLERGVEFMLSATILCNSDGIFNDDTYNYDELGFPFMGKLGRGVYQYECQRKRAHKPDLSKFKLSYK